MDRSHVGRAGVHHGRADFIHQLGPHFPPAGFAHVHYPGRIITRHRWSRHLFSNSCDASAKLHGSPLRCGPAPTSVHGKRRLPGTMVVPGCHPGPSKCLDHWAESGSDNLEADDMIESQCI